MFGEHQRRSENGQSLDSMIQNRGNTPQANRGRSGFFLALELGRGGFGRSQLRDRDGRPIAG